MTDGKTRELDSAPEPAAPTAVALWPLLLVGGTFAATIGEIARAWFTNEASFGSVIFLVSMYMIWSKRRQLAALPVKPVDAGGTILVAIACLGLLLGEHGDMLALREISLLCAVAGVVWLMFGGAHLSLLFAPLLLLVFMFPFVGNSLMALSGHLQIASAVIASAILEAWGTPLVREGTVITMPHLTMEVVKACAGVNHLLALSVLSIPLGYFALRSRVRKVVLFLSALVIGIFANGLRIAMIGIWSFYHPGGPVHGPMDLLWTSAIFFVGTALLVFQAHLMRDDAGQARVAPPPRTAPTLPGPPPRRRLALALCAALLIATSGLTHLVSPTAAALPRGLNALPLQIGSWHGSDVTRLDEPFEDAAPDAVLRRIYRDAAGRVVKLYVGYYRTQRPGHEAINDAFGTLHRGATRTKVDLGGKGTVKVGTFTGGASGGGRGYFWYEVRGRSLARRLAVRLASAAGVLLHRRNDAAVVVVLEQSGDAEARRGQAAPWIGEFASAIKLNLADRPAEGGQP